MPNSEIGQLALEYGLLDEEQLARCLALHERQVPPRPLGEVMVQEGLVKPGALDRLLQTQRRRREGSAADAPAAPPIRRSEAAGRLEGAGTDAFLDLLQEQQAAELHLSAGVRPALRVHGNLLDLGLAPLTAEAAERLVAPLLEPGQREQLERTGSIDRCQVRAGRRLRVHCFRQDRGLSAVVRAVPPRLPPAEQLDLPAIVAAIPNMRQGLVLVTGPRQSGKTTTLGTIVESINACRRRHIVTLEQPLDYVFESRRSVVSQREVGRHVADFPAALRSTLRENPDVIVLGELSDPERIATALSAAETGHLVLATLQTSSAYRTITRILDAYGGRRRNQVRSMLAAVLRIVISQQLLPAVTGDRLHLAAEVLTVTAAVSAMIREDRVHQVPLVMQTSAAQGMVLMDEALIQLVTAGKVSIDEAVRRAEDPRRVLNAAV